MHRFPTYAPELNPAEGIWSHCRRSIIKLAPRTTDELDNLEFDTRTPHWFGAHSGRARGIPEPHRPAG